MENFNVVALDRVRRVCYNWGINQGWGQYLSGFNSRTKIMWYKVFADGSEIDIIYANSGAEAVAIAKTRHGDGAVWSFRPY